MCSLLGGLRKWTIFFMVFHFFSYCIQEGRYADYLEQQMHFDKSKGKMSETDRLMRASELEELHDKLKRRKLGNIRFIGELCKKDLINTNIIHECVWQLLTDRSTQENAQSTTWKKMTDQVM